MKKILFTGSRSGIASRVIDKIKNDYFIYVTVHSLSELKVVNEKYKNYKNIKCFKLDITNSKDREKLFNLDIDILVCNAAIGNSGSIAEINIDKIRENFEVNVFSNFEVVQIVLKNMIKNKKGKVIVMSSLAGLIPIPFLGSYCATKASIIKLAQTLKLELKMLDVNIDVCIIEPGLYNTGFNRLMLDKKYDYMDIDSYFKNNIDIIRKSENICLCLFEKKNLNSIVKKIEKAIHNDNPKLVYSAPFSQRIFSKIISFIYD